METGAAARATGGDAHFQDIGELIWIAAQSPMHRRMQLEEVGALLLVPLAMNQLRRWRRGGAPVGLATWAWLSEEAEAHFLAEGTVPEGAWRSGGRLWFVDVIAPFGDARAICAELRRIIPEGAVAHSARWGGDGSLRKIGRFTPLPRPRAA
jgi:cytolysin-activating lysine-acyltransferase